MRPGLGITPKADRLANSHVLLGRREEMGELIACASPPQGSQPVARRRQPLEPLWKHPPGRSGNGS